MDAFTVFGGSHFTNKQMEKFIFDEMKWEINPGF